MEKIKRKNSVKISKQNEIQLRIENKNNEKNKELELKKELRQIDEKEMVKKLKQINEQNMSYIERLRREIEERNKKLEEFLADKQREQELRRQNSENDHKRKEKAKEALNYMAIWNSWDVDVIRDVLASNNGKCNISKLIKQANRKKKAKNKSKNNIGKYTMRTKNSWVDTDIHFPTAKSLTLS